MKNMPLTIRSLMEVLGVSHMTVLSWARGIPSLNNDPMPRAPLPLKRWATKHGVKLAKDPERVAAKMAPAPSKVKFNAAGKLSSARPTASSRASKTRRTKPS